MAQGGDEEGREVEVDIGGSGSRCCLVTGKSGLSGDSLVSTFLTLTETVLD
jgi:hypothetical protein